MATSTKQVIQRRSHFDSEMKFAHAKAESKAYLKTIRELAGMPTGFQSADLTSGKMLFARIRRSKAVLKMETAARISAMSRGIESQPAKAMLFGPAETEEIAQGGCDRADRADRRMLKSRRVRSLQFSVSTCQASRMRRCRRPPRLRLMA